MNIIAISVPLCAVFVLFIAYALSSWVSRAAAGTDKMKETASCIKEQIYVFRKQEYRILPFVLLVFFLFIGFLTDWKTGGLFLLGAILSVIASSKAMRAAILGNTRAAAYAKEGGMSRALRISFRSGAVFGLCTVGLALLGTGAVYLLLGAKMASFIAGLAFGASLTVAFECISGGLYLESMSYFFRKGGKLGDAAGMTADLFSSYIAAITAAIVISSTAVQLIPAAGNAFLLSPMTGTLYPLALLSIGAIGSALFGVFVRGKGGKVPSATLYIGVILNAVIVLIAGLALSWIFFEGINCGIAVVLGLIFGLTIGKITELISSVSGKHIIRLAGYSRNGTISVLLTGFAAALLSSIWPVLGLIIVVFLAKGVAGTYGIALAAVGALSVTGMMLAAEGFGLVNESAAWIARLTGLSNDVKSITDKLEAVGKRALTAGKGFSAGTAALTVAALLFAYATQSGLLESNLLTARAVIGLLAGCSMPFILSSLLLHTIGKNYDRSDEEKEKELASDEDIMRVVCNADEQVKEQRKFLSKTAMQETAAPILTTITAPFVVGILFGSQALAGFLTGAFCTGLLLVVICGNAGNLFGAVKKYIEADHYGGKGGDSHRAVLIGAHFGDVLNTVVGPSINALVKVMVIEALLFAPVFHAVGGLF